jgi:hypothetical protein
MKPDPYLEARLLGKKERLSVLEKEEILRKLVAVGPEVARERPSRLLWLAPTVAAVAVAVLLPLWLVNQGVDDEFGARGLEGEGPGFTVTCVGPNQGPRCAAGDKLIFRVFWQEHMPYFSVFSRREDGTILWYFPGSEGDKSLDVRAGNMRGVLSLGILVGPEHTPGKYEVFGAFSARPLTKDLLRSLYDHGRGSGADALIVDRREFTVELEP